jgi:hypothetical protein
MRVIFEMKDQFRPQKPRGFSQTFLSTPQKWDTSTLSFAEAVKIWGYYIDSLRLMEDTLSTFHSIQIQILQCTESLISPQWHVVASWHIEF